MYNCTKESRIHGGLCCLGAFQDLAEATLELLRFLTGIIKSRA